MPLIPAGAGRRRRIVVIGGGPGGMAAAVQARAVGFEVTLFENEPRLGGGLIASAAPPHKQNLLWYRDYLMGRVMSSGVDVRTGTTATLDDIIALDPHAVVQAQGTTPLAHRIPGDETSTIHSAYDLLLGKGAEPAAWRGPAIVYGGGETGCETAELLAMHGIDVTLATRSKASELARAAEPLYRKVLLRRLRTSSRISVMTETHLTGITPTEAIVSGQDGTRRLPTTMVVLAQGRRSNDSLHAELKAAGIWSVLIGDASQIARIGEAVHLANAAISEIVGTGAEPPPA